MSVYGMTRAGWRVVFDKGGSYAEQKTSGRKLSLDESRRGWNLHFKVGPVPRSSPSAASSATRHAESIEALKAEAKGKDDAMRETVAKIRAAEQKSVTFGCTERCCFETADVDQSNRWCPFGRLPQGVSPAV